MEAVYFCIIEGVDPEKTNVEDDNKNAFIYACENRRVELLRMMIENFQVCPEQKFNYKYINRDNKERIVKGCTGFIHACYNDNTNIVELLIDKYPQIIYQKNFYGEPGFHCACINNSK